jgi:hypothetical protein
MTAPVWLRLDRESLETNLLDRDHFFHCERFFVDWREEENMKREIRRASQGCCVDLFVVSWRGFRQKKLEGNQSFVQQNVQYLELR